MDACKLVFGSTAACLQLVAHVGHRSAFSTQLTPYNRLHQIIDRANSVRLANASVYLCPSSCSACPALPFLVWPLRNVWSKGKDVFQ